MSATVEVRALHCAKGNLPYKLLFNDVTPENENDLVPLPVWAFYIHHPGKNIHAMWDLGMIKDLDKLPSTQVTAVRKYMRPEIPQDAAEILTENGVAPEDISYIIVSHAHLDHTGDPGKFPNATVVYGQGTQGHCRPAYPVNPESKFLELSFPEGRTRELGDADFTTTVGGWPRACDFFGDGSVLLLDAPGHMPGHMVALVTTEKGRLLLGGDSCHHCRHLTEFEEGGKMSYHAHMDMESARVNLRRIDEFLKENKDTKLCLAHVGGHGEGNFNKVLGYA